MVRARSKSKSKQFHPVVVEAMETRLLLSAVHGHQLPHAVIHHKPAVVRHALKPAHAKKTKAPLAHLLIQPGINLANVQPYDGSPAIPPFKPTAIQHFYGIDSISFNGTPGNGAGQTIAIIDAYDQPALVDSTDSNFDNSDLHQFDLRYNLPDPPSFVKIPQAGQTALPTQTDPGWEVEEDLDVEWSHAIAPAANIVLIECASENDYDILGAGIEAAKDYPGVTVVSMSFGGAPESGVQGDELTYDNQFTSTTANPGITWVASTGDGGAYNTSYPALSPNVVAVGGTSITTSDDQGSYGSETVWNNSYGSTGGAASIYETKPYYQANITAGGSFRATPDVAFDGDPGTGVFIYDSDKDPQRQIFEYAGTSLSSPCWAGLIAIADQGRALEGLGPLDGFNQTLPRLYELPSTDFHDITTGNNNGNTAAAGYDLASGLGTPVANQLVSDLAGGDSISGRVFTDTNGNGIDDGSDTPLSGQIVYLDLNNNGTLDPDEPTAVTDSTGLYTFTDQPGGLTGTVRLTSMPAGDLITTASPSFITSYNTSQAVNIGLFPTIYTTNTAATNYTVNLDSTATDVQISVNGTLTDAAPLSLVSSLTFALTGTGDSLTVDATNGNPIPIGGINESGGTLNVIGTASGNDSFNISSSTFAFGSSTIEFAPGTPISLSPGAGNDSLSVASGSINITPAIAGILVRNFSSISIAGGASILFDTATSHSNRMLVEATSLSILGQLDLGGNDMIIHDGDLPTITNLLASGYDGGNWNGNGIASSAAANDSTHLTALAVASNDLGGGATLFGGASQNSFDGTSPAASDILIKYTFYGDANLDGIVDGSDYSRIDNAILFAQTGWFNGDFNYDQQIDGSDYTLIDNAYNTQSAAM